MRSETNNHSLMELRQLRYFLAIADTLNFTEAARICCLSQSAISQQIKSLEDELDTQLFNRTSHSVMLTETGTMLLPLARRIVADADDCRQRMNDVRGLLCGQLTIGLTYTLEPYLRRTMVRFMKLYPKVTLNIKYMTIPALIHNLRSGALDMAFSIIVAGETDWVDSEPVTSYRMCAAMRDTHPLATRKSLSFADLRNQSFILPEQGHSGDNAVNQLLGADIGHLNVRATVNDPRGLIQLLRHTNCISILSECSVQNIDELVAIPIDELSTPFTTYVHFLRGAYRKRSANVFLDLMREVIAADEMLKV